MSGINIVGGATSTSISNNNTFNYNYNYFTGTCSTDGATEAKVVTSTNNITLAPGLRILVKFDNKNTVAGALTLNVNSTGAKSIYNEAGVAVSATCPAYFPAGATVEFYYDGTNWVYVNRIVDSYINGATFYNKYANGWVEQGGIYSFPVANVMGCIIPLPIIMANSMYHSMVTTTGGPTEKLMVASYPEHPTFSPTTTSAGFLVVANGGNIQVGHSFKWEVKGY